MLERNSSTKLLKLSFRVYAHYPKEVPQFFQECFPFGYTQRRITRFGRLNDNLDIVDEEGEMETYHEVRRGGIYPKKTEKILKKIP